MGTHRYWRIAKNRSAKAAQLLAMKKEARKNDPNAIVVDQEAKQRREQRREQRLAAEAEAAKQPQIIVQQPKKRVVLKSVAQARKDQRMEAKTAEEILYGDP